MNKVQEKFLRITTYKNTNLEQTERIVVNQISNNRFKIIRMPSKLFGLGYGDTIARENDTITLVERQGFVGCRIYGRQFVHNKTLEKIMALVKSSGGVYEVFVNRERLFLFLVGFPIEMGWKNIQQFCDSSFENCKWEYSNIFDENNQLLEWWKGENPALSILLAE